MSYATWAKLIFAVWGAIFVLSVLRGWPVRLVVAYATVWIVASVQVAIAELS